MQTVSLNVMTLSVPCENRCRYCLLSYDGKLPGADFSRSREYALRFRNWLLENRPEISFLFSWGYSMEHPHLLDAVGFCRSIGSPAGEFLQFDGMKLRSDPELDRLLSGLKAAGIRMIDLTFYGTEAYHDRFAARAGDFDLMIRTLAAANRIGIAVSVSVALSGENIGQLEELLDQLKRYETARVYCFVPHSEGRGRLLDRVRLTLEDCEGMSSRARACFDRNRFRTESEWVRSGGGALPQKRALTLNLTGENIARFESIGFAETLAYLEGLDDAYYDAIPCFAELLQLYGDPRSSRLYSARDLYLNYQRRYIADHGLTLHDVNDERQCSSRRF